VRGRRRDPDGGEPEVAELDVAGGADQHVLGLEVAVEDPLLVEVLEAEEGLGGVEARL